MNKVEFCKEAIGYSLKGKLISALQWSIITIISGFLFFYILLVTQKDGVEFVKKIPLMVLIIFFILFFLIGFLIGFFETKYPLLVQFMKPTEKMLIKYQSKRIGELNDEIKKCSDLNKIRKLQNEMSEIFTSFPID